MTEHSGGADLTVVPFAPRSAGRAAVPTQRESEDRVSPMASMEDQTRFFSGFVHASWMTVLLTGLLLGLLMVVDTFI